MRYLICTTHWKAIIPARHSGAGLGHWHNGECYVPDGEALAAVIPYRLRKSLARSSGCFWFQRRIDQPAMMHLHGSRGKLLATVYASLVCTEQGAGA
jgi:hypothetical protein